MRSNRSVTKRCRRLVRSLRKEADRLPGGGGHIAAAAEILERALAAGADGPADGKESLSAREGARLRARIVAEILGRQAVSHGDGEESEACVVFPGRHFSATEVLLFLSFNRKSGTVVVHTGEERIMVELRDGLLVDAVSDGAPRSSLLGEILVEQGALSEETLRECLSKPSHSDRRIGQVLFESGAVRDEDLECALRTQIQRHLKRCLAVEGRDVAFHAGGGREVPIMLHLDLNTILLESMAALEGPPATCAP